MSAGPVLQPIGELEKSGAVLEIQDGNHGEKHPVSSDYVDSGIPFIMANNILDGTVDLRGCKYIRKEQADSLRVGFARAGDVLLTHKGTVGNVAVVPQVEDYVMLTPQVTYYRLNPAMLDNKYFAYALRDPDFRSRMNSISGQSTRPYVGITAQRYLLVMVHPLRMQHKIAAILSAYDDLIENNLRRIKILEEMAQNLYREWFVKYRFPGHQHARLTDSPLGRIPEGWEVKRLGDAFLIVLGGTPSRDRPEFWRNGTVPWINSGKVNDLRVTEPSELITELALKKSAAKLMPPGTTLIAITGATLGQVSILEIEASANQSVVGVISEDEKLIEWLHLTIRERISSIINHASGGAQQHINKGIVDDVVVAVPPGNIPEKFHNIAQPLYRHIAGLIFKNSTLRCTRDLLLPRLISGEVDVSELDIAVPDEAGI